MTLLFGLPDDAAFAFFILYFIGLIFVIVGAHRKWNRGQLRNGTFVIVLLLSLFIPLLGPIISWIITNDEV